MIRVFVRGSVVIEPRCDSTVAVMQRLHLLGARVAERPRQRLQLAGERLRLGELLPLRLLVGQHRQRRDAHDRAVDRSSQVGWRAG